jgi:hypothetical protein
MNELLELLKVFALTEREQESFFPKLESSLVVAVGTFEVTTDSARMVALCILCEACKKASARTDAVGQISAEIFSFATLLIEVGGIYPWLFFHPSVFQRDDGAVDPTLYGNWSVLRRLCALGSGTTETKKTVLPFAEIVRPYVSGAA